MPGGACIADVAIHLFLSEGTVCNCLSVAIQKLGTQNRVEAPRRAEERGGCEVSREPASR
jgi:two-component system, NarL family, response regulator DesR